MVKRLKEELIKQGYVPQRNRADAFEIHHLDVDAEYRVAIIPFKTGSSNEQNYILWTDSPCVTIVGTKIKQFDDIVEESYKVTNYKVSADQVHTTDETITDEEVKEFKQQYVENSNDNISTADFPNCDINFNCVATTAAKGGLLYGVCASCAGGFIPNCFACAGSGILFVDSDCNLCN